MARLQRMLRLVFRNLYYYRVDYIRTFVLLRMAQLFVVIPTVMLLFYFTLDVLDIQTVTEQNMLTLLGHPLVLTVLSLIVLVLLLFIYYEMGLLMLLAYHQQRAIPYSLNGLWKRLNQKVMYFISFQTLIFLLYLLLIVPLISSVLPLSLTQNLQIPHFIVDELMASTKGKLLYFGAIAILLVISLRFIFTLPFFSVYQWATIWDAVKMSWRFSRRKLVETLGMIGIIMIVHMSVLFTMLFLTFLPLFIIERIYPSISLVVAAFTLTLAEGILLVFFTILQALFSQILVLVAFRLTHEKPLILQEESFRQTIKDWTIISGLYAFFLVSGINVINLENTVYEPETKIIAHRGFMERGVENTVSSLVASADAGADMVEIDIQQTKDGQFVVFHDASLTRLAGRSEKIYNLTLDELTQINVQFGKSMDKIPSLAVMLQKSEELRVKLLIEVKTHGYETPDMIERLIALLDEYNALDVHYIQSLDGTIIKQIKARQPRLKVGLVYAVAVGSLPKTNADFIALEQYFVSGRLIKQAHAENKELFVWTVNTNSGLQQFYEQKVDGIITNHPDKATSIRQTFDQDQYFVRRVLNKLNINF